jgi:hypothetical protein
MNRCLQIAVDLIAIAFVIACGWAAYVAVVS